MGRYIQTRWVKVLEAVMVAALSATMGFLLIYALNDCVPVKDDAGEHEPSNVQVAASSLLTNQLVN